MGSNFVGFELSEMQFARSGLSFTQYGKIALDADVLLFQATEQSGKIILELMGSLEYGFPDFIPPDVIEWVMNEGEEIPF